MWSGRGPWGSPSSGVRSGRPPAHAGAGVAGDAPPALDTPAGYSIKGPARPARSMGAAPAAGRRRSGGAAMAEKRNKAAIAKRLARLEGQVRGVARMVEEDRYCVDVLNQTAAIRSALKAVERLVIEDHARHCVEEAVARGARTTARQVPRAPSSWTRPGDERAAVRGAGALVGPGGAPAGELAVEGLGGDTDLELGPSGQASSRSATRGRLRISARPRRAWISRAVRSRRAMSAVVEAPMQASRLATRTARPPRRSRSRRTETPRPPDRPAPPGRDRRPSGPSRAALRHLEHRRVAASEQRRASGRRAAP